MRVSAMELAPKDTLDIDEDVLNRGGFGGNGEAARSGNDKGDAARTLSGEWWCAGIGMRDMHVLLRRREVLWRCSSCFVHGPLDEIPDVDAWTPGSVSPNWAETRGRRKRSSTRR